MKRNNTLKLTILALMTALCYISFTYLKITIPTPLGYTSFHLGNVFLILCSLILGGTLGGISGAIGMGLADIMDPRYIMIAPKTIIIKMSIGLICGFCAHKIFNINNSNSNQNKKVVLSISIAMICNVILEPSFGYFYYKFVLKATDKALSALTTFNLLSTGVNAILTVIIASFLYIRIAKYFNNKYFVSNSKEN